MEIPFFKIAAPEVVSGISGESEQRVRSLFAEAMMVAPSILFIDEIDSITPKRDTAGKESERRVVTQILTCMDGMSTSLLHLISAFFKTYKIKKIYQKIHNRNSYGISNICLFCFLLYVLLLHQEDLFYKLLRVLPPPPPLNPKNPSPLLQPSHISSHVHHFRTPSTALLRVKQTTKDPDVHRHDF